MTGKQHGNRRNDARPRAPLAVRAVLIALSAVSALGAGWAGANVLAVRGYDTATASLMRNLEAASKDDADLDRLGAAQQQTDAQFADAGALAPVLLPSVRGPIDTNTEISKRLTALIAEAKAQQQNGTGTTGTDGSEVQGADRQQSQEEQGLSDEQRKKVDELLQQNQQLATVSPSPSASSSTSTSAPGEQSASKPW
ncbi:DUF6466 family protein [Bifidobacterium vespertilionis]|uniref:Cell surface protein n=1 Tax=Bifidobacterium vespertilionis TaxID=2562524 RepID=A0A5J5DZ71_9BIFI|nr:DUF6466 family protein [Bifidobacterium vespertilionis]KAA8822115.1 cell surface protein [Bifidobacterium vespertilionis]KAA8824522.1 cell surface protein [Bifidobacterium vespertilionis]